MTRDQLHNKASEKSWNNYENQYVDAIIQEMYHITYDWKYAHSPFLGMPNSTWKPTEPIPRKIKFARKFRLKDIREAFLELDLQVTSYSCEYGKSIVYFKPISDFE